MLRTTVYVDWNGHHMKLTWIPFEEAPDITKFIRSLERMKRQHESGWSRPKFPLSFRSMN
ncbi:hypothetical protein AZ66_29290 [Paenibacillus sp. E194]|uniref:hypothetical protein n=1 Tax=Paenibacillus sp. E194 TaxID=1458845 RepID=UPI0005CB42E1|nr:hypothetical protein [Paenibacillus sp. E194]KJB84703.1 hypothetical protein AZ66_29290 [Paenibacillus sp. E194]